MPLLRSASAIARFFEDSCSSSPGRQLSSFTDLGEVRALGKETAYHAVMVLHAALLPGAVTVTVPHLEAAAAVYAPAQLVILHELTAVVRGQ